MEALFDHEYEVTTELDAIGEPAARVNFLNNIKMVN
jgi:hypothetical protein